MSPLGSPSSSSTASRIPVTWSLGSPAPELDPAPTPVEPARPRPLPRAPWLRGLSAVEPAPERMASRRARAAARTAGSGEVSASSSASLSSPGAAGPGRISDEASADVPPVSWESGSTSLGASGR